MVKLYAYINPNISQNAPLNRLGVPYHLPCAFLYLYIGLLSTA